MKKIKQLILVGTMVFGALVGTACGSETEQKTTDVTTGKPTTSEIRAEIEAENQKAEEESKKSRQEIKVATEEDIVVNIDGIEVSLSQTWEEFQKVVEENGWTYLTDDSQFPREGHYTGSVDVQTHVGKIQFNFMDNPDGTGSEVRGVRILPSDINYSADVNVCGVNIYTTPDDIGEQLPLAHEVNSNYISATYQLDEHLELHITTFKEENNSFVVSVSRTFYFGIYFF